VLSIGRKFPRIFFVSIHEGLTGARGKSSPYLIAESITTQPTTHRNKPRLRHPILQRQSLDAFKVLSVIRHQRRVHRKRVCRDHCVCRADGCATVF